VEQAIQHWEPEHHWTAASDDAFLHRITFDFLTQVEKKMESTPISQAELAERLGVTESAVSRVLNSPQNLTLRTIVRYARAIGIKVSLVAYDDDDSEDFYGPVNSEIFSMCWQKAGRPHDYWELANNFQAISTTTISVHWISWCQLEFPVVQNAIDTWGNPCLVSWARAKIQYAYEEYEVPVSLMISRTGSNEFHG
jgi:transcriptional regulator with XRE-family HTH domain